jgi:anti-sigma-K factor RskA
MTRDEWFDSAAGYLLHALEPGEDERFEQHLAGCASCRAEVERLRVAAEALPASPVQLSPPADLKDRIMSIVNAEAELLRAAGPEADAPERGRDREPRRRRVAVLRPGWWSLRPGLALAGAVAVLALGVLAGVLASSATRGDQTRTVVAQTAPPGAKVRLIVREDGHSTLVADRLPAPGSGRVYQVWLQRGKAAPKPTNALFDVRSGGSASVDVPGSLDQVDNVLVTSEPDGGSRTPSRPPILSVVPS